MEPSLQSLCFLPEGSNLISSLTLFCATDTDSTVMDSQWWNTGYGPDSRRRPGSQKVKGACLRGLFFSCWKETCGRKSGTFLVK